MNSNKRAGAGFTLIELMIVIAIVSVFVTMALGLESQRLRAVESEAQLQQANRALRSQVEILRAEHIEPAAGQNGPFADRVTELRGLPSGRGELKSSEDPARPGLLRVEVEVFWQDARLGARSVHTVVYKEKS